MNNVLSYAHMKEIEFTEKGEKKTHPLRGNRERRTVRNTSWARGPRNVAGAASPARSSDLPFVPAEYRWSSSSRTPPAAHRHGHQIRLLQEASSRRSERGPLPAAANSPRSSSSTTSAGAASAPSWSGTTWCAHDFRIDPLGPENLLVIAPGPLTGTLLSPRRARRSFVAISPQTGIYGDSSIGGSAGRGAAPDGRRPAEHHRAGRRELSVLFIDEDETRDHPHARAGRQDLPRSRGDDQGPPRHPRGQGGRDRPGRREPGALRLRQRRLVAQRRPHRHGRRDGLEEPQGDRRPRQQGPARRTTSAA